MNKTELKGHEGKFGKIRAGITGYKKTMNGIIKEMDGHGNIYFVDNDGYGFIFPPHQVDTFMPKEFSPLPEKEKGKDIYWKSGRVYFKKTNKECELTK
jgi:hypothetical protein